MAVRRMVQAGAVPIQYNLNYAATTGPDGIGSFVFDQDNGLMTAFNWNFGGVLGGIPDLPIPLSPGLPTRGQFIFEMLSHTDVSPLINCVLGGCVSSSSVLNPLNGFKFTLRNTAVDTSYEYERNGALFSAGLVSIVPTSVPEPAGFALFGLGVLMLGVRRRRA